MQPPAAPAGGVRWKTTVVSTLACSPVLLCLCRRLIYDFLSRHRRIAAFFQFCVYGKFRPVTQEVPAANWSHMTLIKQLCCNTRSIWLCKLLQSFR